MAYQHPVPGGTIGRTDQGVDISGAPGTPVYAIADETLVGEIPNWYNGQPFYWFKQVGTNIYNYVAEQISLNVKQGQTVKAGQQIGTIAPSGTGLELGWATSSGQTVARATTGYTEGQATPAGTSYLQQVIKGKGGATPSQQQSLSQLWIDAGGDPKVANIMAAVAMAESSGNPSIVQQGQPYATTGWGLWQITPGNSVPSVGTDAQLLDPLTNARAAVAKYKSQGLGAWTTYTSGAYKKFMGQDPTVSATGITRPGGTTQDSSGDPMGAISAYQQLRDMPRQAAPQTKNPFQWWVASFTGNWDKITGQ